MTVRRDRDKAIERLLQKSLEGREPSPADACPDAETLAAWVDDGLSRSEAARIETHASTCARCRALLAVMAETTPDASARAAREHERWWRLRWLVPLAAAAAAVAIWVAVPNDERPALPAQANVELSKSAAPPPQPDATADRFNAQTAPPQAPDVANAASAKAENKTASVGASEREQRKEDAALEDKKESDRLDTLGAREAGASPAPADAAQSRPALAETVARSRAAFRAPVEVASPDPSIRWRIAAGGVVERTTNGGTAWQSVPTGIDADLTAGASPSVSVCWLVGRAGTVLLSTDGRTWRRVPFPEMTDLTAVQAASAQTATISTADGRTFRTTDGGLTWN